MKAQTEPNVINKLIDAPAVEMKVRWQSCASFSARDLSRQRAVSALQVKARSRRLRCLFSLLATRITTSTTSRSTSTREASSSSRASTSSASPSGRTRATSSGSASASMASASPALTPSSGPVSGARRALRRARASPPPSRRSARGHEAHHRAGAKRERQAEPAHDEPQPGRQELRRATP